MGDTLGCDSGGWYLFSKILDEVMFGKSMWARIVNQEAVSAYGRFTKEELAILIFQALFPQGRAKVRSQGAWEQMRDANRPCKLWAIRATSGHRPCRILDPLQVIPLMSSREQFPESSI